jgi:hypothetical protein
MHTYIGSNDATKVETTAGSQPEVYIYIIYIYISIYIIETTIGLKPEVAPYPLIPQPHTL